MAELGRHLLQANASMCDNLGGAGFGYWYSEASGGESIVCNYATEIGWLKSRGTDGEYKVSQGCQWMAFALCVASLMYYGYHAWKATVGWEELYVVLVEMIKVCIEVPHEFDSPATLYLNTGNTVLWIRFGEWLLTCPVILIHLSNITGLKDDYTKRTMMLLVSDIGCIVCGITSALSTTFVKWIFFLMGLCYGCNTYFHAAKVYIESYHVVPKGVCRHLVRGMAWCFFVAWTMFPLLFVFGPEGFKIMSRNGSNIAHTIADIISKQAWSMQGHILRVKIHEHIIIHGNITKPTKVKVAGIELETEQMVDEEDEEGVNQGTKHLANRESFLIMRDNMKKQGIETRASFDDRDPGAKGGKGLGAGFADTYNQATATLEPGRVILAVPDISMVDFFRQQFAALPAPIELVPALGLDNTLSLVQQAMALGGLDCVLIHPEFLRDRTPAGLLPRLRAAGQRVVAFGWAPVGPVRELIETAGVDAYLEGPSFGMPINPAQLVMVLTRVQAARKAMMGMGMMGLTGGVPGYGGMPSQYGGLSSQYGGMSGQYGGVPGFGGMPGMMGGIPGLSPNGMGGLQMSTTATNGGVAGAQNPLFGLPGGLGTGISTPHGYGSPAVAATAAPTPQTLAQPAPAAPAATGVSAAEAEMLQQLMGEINRLKAELGER